MNEKDLTMIYISRKNKRGLHLLKKLNDNQIVRFLENEEDNAILQDFIRLDIWFDLKSRSYINRHGQWVIFPTPDQYLYIISGVTL